MLQLPERPPKPRSFGITSIHDVSLTVHQLQDILSDYGDFVDLAKFGVGTAYVTPQLKAKIELLKAHGVEPYCGGTLFEKFYHQRKLDEYTSFLKEKGIEWIEISTGTIDIDLQERISITKKMCKNFKVLAEVGTKDADAIMAPSSWIKEINHLLEAGASYVITEGRNSGTAGIFRPSGELRTGLIQDIIANCDIRKIIFEAPRPKAQMYFINQVGNNVNLGNIAPHDLLLLETQRLGLRSETFFIQS